MQPNTVNNHLRHRTRPVPPELLEALARALAAALIPPPRRPTAAGNGGGGTGGLPDRRAAGAAAGNLPGDSPAASYRRDAAAHRGVPRRPQDHPPLPAAVRRGVRGQRPGGSRPGRLRRRLAGAGQRARTVTARPPRHRTLAAPARFAARWRELAACRGTDLEVFFPGRGESAEPARQVCAACPVRQPCLDYAITNRIVHGIWGGRPNGSAVRCNLAVVRHIAAESKRGDLGRGHGRWYTVEAVGRSFGLSRTSVARIVSRALEPRHPQPALRLAIVPRARQLHLRARPEARL